MVYQPVAQVVQVVGAEHSLHIGGQGKQRPLTGTKPVLQVVHKLPFVQAVQSGGHFSQAPSTIANTEWVAQAVHTPVKSVQVVHSDEQG